jgi:hypothetical protein
METILKFLKFVNQLNAEDMHLTSQEWLSELKFMKDEHLFFEDLVTEFTPQLIALNHFSNNKEIMNAIYKSQKRNDELIEEVKEHENGLQIMVDGIDQPQEEKAYRTEHKRLILTIKEVLKEYNTLKKQLFNIINSIKKENKTRHLLNKK